MRVLFLTSSRFGQVSKIAHYIGRELQLNSPDLELDYLNLEDISEVPKIEVDCIVIGASIRYGHFHKNLLKFTNYYAQYLNAMNSVFFSVNLVARNPAKNSADTNIYTHKYLTKTLFKPKLTRVFAGALRYSKYGFFDKTAIRLIMKITGGETKTTQDFEYTDWQQVTAFAREIEQLISN